MCRSCAISRRLHPWARGSGGPVPTPVVVSWLAFLKPSGGVGAGGGAGGSAAGARRAAGKAEGLAATGGLVLCAQPGELPCPWPWPAASLGPMPSAPQTPLALSICSAVDEAGRRLQLQIGLFCVMQHVLPSLVFLWQPQKYYTKCSPDIHGLICISCGVGCFPPRCSCLGWLKSSRLCATLLTFILVFPYHRRAGGGELSRKRAFVAASFLLNFRPMNFCIASRNYKGHGLMSV